MSRISILCCVFLCLATRLQAQEVRLHTPSELLSIADKSKLSYNLRVAEQPFDHRPDTANILAPDFYRVVTASGFGTRKYEPNIPSTRLFRKGIAASDARQFDTASAYFLQAYVADSTYTTALTHAGQAYEPRGKYDMAAMLLKKSIARNYIDYEAHWRLAHVYAALGKNILAQESIIVAHLLNRNHPRIKASLKTILALNDHPYDDSWYFNPQAEVKQLNEKDIDVVAASEWIGYAMGQAIWLYEPGYKESMSNRADLRFNMDMQKELLMAELVYMETSTRKEKKAYPVDLKALKLATEKKLFQAYVFYEIFLPQYPQLGLQLPEALMNDMREYILDVRCQPLSSLK